MVFLIFDVVVDRRSFAAVAAGGVAVVLLALLVALPMKVVGHDD